MKDLHRYILTRYRLARLSSRQRRPFAWYYVRRDGRMDFVLVMGRDSRPRGIYEIYKN